MSISVHETMTLAIIGHSFIRRLQDHYLLNFDQIDLHVAGLGGATVRDLADSDELLQLLLYRPTRVFIQIGGNDITKSTSAEQVFHRIRNFVTALVTDHGVHEVVIGSLFPRYKPRFIEFKDYEIKRTEINKMLKEEYETSSNITFWKLRGLVNPPRNAFVDGVHLTEHYEQVYAKQIKLALFCKSFN